MPRIPESLHPDPSAPFALASLRHSLLAAGGPDLLAYRSTFVLRRVARRMRELGVATLADYRTRVAEDGSEAAALASALSVRVTRFRRDSGTFAAIERVVLPALLAKPGRTLRILSAGASTGEECWSLAIAAAEGARLLGSKRAIRVEGFDLDPESVRIASRGRYPAAALAAYRPALAERWFLSDGSDRIVRPELRALVRHRVADLLRLRPHRCYDLVVCRNLFIYLNDAGKARALENLGRALAPGGYLVIGRNEWLPCRGHGLTAVDSRERIYASRGRSAA